MPNRNEDMLKEMIEYFGEKNIPDPEQYPIRFQFLTKSFEHYKRMDKGTNVAT
jgi:hypothetical protein